MDGTYETGTFFITKQTKKKSFWAEWFISVKEENETDVVFKGLLYLMRISVVDIRYMCGGVLEVSG